MSGAAETLDPKARAARITFMRAQACYLDGALGIRRAFLKNRSYLMAKKAVKRREWTSADVKTLRSLAKKKTQAGRIAKALKRTEGATRQKAFSRGLSLDAR
jgi:hypothetical protein